jgi:hypothetical protein
MQSAKLPMLYEAVDGVGLGEIAFVPGKRRELHRDQ